MVLLGVLFREIESQLQTIVSSVQLNFFVVVEIYFKK